ncbi:hypothetical protein [Roseinatronobacter ekhonensis]|nr:hypothetical protein [Roseibaca ekhonensis]
MTRTRKRIDPPLPQAGTRRGNGAIALQGVDGRSTMARRFREITAGIESDLGGDLTEAQKHITARAATLACWCEERETELAQGQDFDALQYSTVSNALRRLLSDLGLERKAKDITPDLHSYIAAKGQANG